MRQKLYDSQDKIYTDRAKGGQIRSRIKWIQEGEINSEFFLGLEKSRQINNTLFMLRDSCGNEFRTTEKILAECITFYQTLYSSGNINNTKIENYVEETNVKSLNENEADTCEGPITQ